MIDGLTKHSQTVPSLIIAGTTHPTPAIIAVLQARIDAAKATVSTRAIWQTTVQADRDERAKTKGFVSGLRRRGGGAGKRPKPHRGLRHDLVPMRHDTLDRVKDLYGSGPRALQDRFDTRRLADRIAERLVRDHLTDDDRAFVERMDMFFLATVDKHGRPSCSYKGGEPGFVRVVDEKTIAFPSFDGNGMYLSMGNVLDTRHVGLLFIDFAGQSRLRVEGEASIDIDDTLLAAYPEAQLVVRVRTRAVYPNCPRYIHKMQLVERSRFTPRQGCATPVPSWKRSEWAADALPAGDPARDPTREVVRK